MVLVGPKFDARVNMLLRILGAMFLSFLIAWISLLWVPAVSIKDEPIFVAALNFLFCILVACGAFVGGGVLRNDYFDGESDFDRLKIAFNLKLASAASVLGFLLIFYDRVFIRGIDYTQGLRASRYVWLDSVGGSFPSVVGNIIVHFSYYGIFVLVLHGWKVSAKVKLFSLFSCLVGVFGHSALNGGRSNVLLAIVIFLLALVLKKNKKTRAGKNGRKTLRFKLLKLVGFCVLIALAAMYVKHVIDSSADIGGVDLRMITSLGIEMLYGKPLDSFYENQNPSDIYLFFVYIVSYLFHGNWTAQVAYTLDSRPGSYVFFPIGVVLNGLGVLDAPFQPGVFADSGAFISLPGALYYDFSWGGMAVSSLVLGLIVGVGACFASGKSRVGSLKMAVIIYSFTMVVLAPIVPGYGFAYLNFIVFSFVLAELVNFIRFGKKICFLR